MARHTPPLPDSMISLTEDISVPALPDAEIQALARLADASPEDFQRQAARLFRRLAIAGFQAIQAPRNYRELQTVVDLWRKLEGLDAKEKGAMPVGLVGVLRSVNRRVIDADPVENEPAFD